MKRAAGVRGKVAQTLWNTLAQVGSSEILKTSKQKNRRPIRQPRLKATIQYLVDHSTDPNLTTTHALVGIAYEILTLLKQRCLFRSLHISHGSCGSAHDVKRIPMRMFQYQSRDIT